MRIGWDDETVVELNFLAKGRGKSMVAVTHRKLADRSAVDAMKKVWSDHLDKLTQVLT